MRWRRRSRSEDGFCRMFIQLVDGVDKLCCVSREETESLICERFCRGADLLLMTL